MPDDATRLTVLSYNIHHAEGVDGKLDLARIANVIRTANPDLVALQEVDDRTKRTGTVNQTEELGRLTGMRAVFAQAMSYQGGGYGQAILSRWPIQQRSVVTLPQQPDREPRISVVARLKVNGTGPEIVFAGTHLEHQLEEIRVQQARRLHQILSTNTVPTIVAGDFNSIPESAPMQIFANGWTDAAGSDPQPTIPSAAPKKRIDYILLHPVSAWRVIRTEVLSEAVASDHRALLTVLELVQ